MSSSRPRPNSRRATPGRTSNLSILQNMSTYPTDSQALRDQIDHPPPFVTILQPPDDVDVPVDNKDKTKSTVTPSPPPTSTVDDGVAAVASVGAAAETVGPPPTSTVDDGVTAAASVSTENPSTVGAAAEAAGCVSHT